MIRIKSGLKGGVLAISVGRFIEIITVNVLLLNVIHKVFFINFVV